jgi:hypothetical protein
MTVEGEPKGGTHDAEPHCRGADPIKITPELDLHLRLPGVGQERRWNAEYAWSNGQFAHCFNRFTA